MVGESPQAKSPNIPTDIYQFGDNHYDMIT